MKRTFIAIMLLVAIFGLITLAAATETVFQSKSYLDGEAGLIAPWEKGVMESNNLGGPVPDFARDYMIGEGGITNPIEEPVSK